MEGRDADLFGSASVALYRGIFPDLVKELSGFSSGVSINDLFGLISGVGKKRHLENDMEKLPSLNKGIVKVTSLDDIEEEKKYWMSKSPLERIEAIEISRRMIYGRDRVTSRLQRFFEIAELS